jgi:HEPN domain-containing protein
MRGLSNMKNQRDLARGWLKKSKNDLEAAQLLLRENGPTDTICFHCQQSVEKALKSILALRGEQIPKTHDLEEIQEIILKAEQIDSLAKFDLEELTDYGVDVRYDFEFEPSGNDSKDALKLATQVFDVASQIIHGK